MRKPTLLIPIHSSLLKESDLSRSLRRRALKEGERVEFELQEEPGKPGRSVAMDVQAGSLTERTTSNGEWSR